MNQPAIYNELDSCVTEWEYLNVIKRLAGNDPDHDLFMKLQFTRDRIERTEKLFREQFGIRYKVLLDLQGKMNLSDEKLVNAMVNAPLPGWSEKKEGEENK